MFDKILIANRGEIACRIIKTMKKLGILSVIVYSDADSHSQAVQLADEAYYLGESASTSSYLNGEKILAIALKSGAQAIHPGYGFLSENPHFARSCEKAGIVFIGPPASAIEAMGSKSAAKKIMEASHVPVIPGYHGDNQNTETLLAEACHIGFPVLIKAAAGGGGKGMRAVFKENEFLDALASAKREAQSSFGDEVMIIEKYLTEPRHIEIQIFCDQHGNAVYLFERDCSIQRRHQKIIEEAPAPHFNTKLRDAMGKTAIQAAKSIGYVGAGTIEFLLDQDGSFYFMEMNTRLQVEHPVTEMITQQDLVEWQLKVASNQPLPLQQKDLAIHGHAIEVRIYAENPDKQFLPSTGKLSCFRLPPQDFHTRVDTGFIEGDTITSYYDPMMAKLITWGEDRPTAVRHLLRALEQYYVIGVKNNIAFIQKIIQHPSFKEASISTRFIEQHQNDWQKPTTHFETPINPYLILACLYEATEKVDSKDFSNDPWKKAWESLLVSRKTFSFRINNDIQSITLEKNPSAKNASAHQGNHCAMIHHYSCSNNNEISAQIDDQYYRASIIKESHQMHLLTREGIFTFDNEDLELAYEQNMPTHGQLTAPMPGLVVAVYVKEGQSVKSGERLMVIEAMKMEHTLYAPHDGTIKEIYFPISSQVSEDDQLMTID